MTDWHRRIAPGALGAELWCLHPHVYRHVCGPVYGHVSGMSHALLKWRCSSAYLGIHYTNPAGLDPASRRTYFFSQVAKAPGSMRMALIFGVFLSNFPEAISSAVPYV